MKITTDDIENAFDKYRINPDGTVRLATEIERQEALRAKERNVRLHDLKAILRAGWPAWAVTADQAGWTVVPPGKPGDPWRVLEGESPK